MTEYHVRLTEHSKYEALRTHRKSNMLDWFGSGSQLKSQSEDEMFGEEEQDLEDEEFGDEELEDEEIEVDEDEDLFGV